jgi:hypothetical protein
MAPPASGSSRIERPNGCKHPDFDSLEIRGLSKEVLRYVLA